ncbi:MAG: Coproporphyrin ferrochelatase [uncultured Corynebacteriales bacterium]|uniref:Coproporphyrin III ferrochelatase n=1 Tax=uncultured Mycobacteriales bacterium TaxID=581187 RepID=A0A6J4JSA5_9ACTN|nr:MAG: Coproporphyrin ferrochelatase [uncultured Corynebacteriales bacterium]
MTEPYDALLLLSFGGPEGPDDVLPFLENVVRGRGVPRDRLLAVAEHYQHFGGVSPINEQNRALLAAIRAEVDLPVYWGNRNWAPYVEDAVATMRDDGVRRALVFVTSAYTSFSGCRQYQDDLARARAAAGPDAPVLEKLRHYFNHPGFVEPAADGVRAALATVSPDARLVFTAHSIPTSMEVASGPGGHLYSTQLREASRLVAESVRGPGAEFDLVWQSRSGPPSVPWLEPDISDHLEALAASGVRAVVVSPIGFVSDHVEVLWDLDEEAAETAGKLGLEYARAATVGTDPRFVRMVAQLVAERTSGVDKLALGPMGPSHDTCPLGCCPAPRRPAPAEASRS